MTTLRLSLLETRANWRRSMIFAVILLGAVATQLFTSISSAASKEAVQTYGTSVFGYSGTYRTLLRDSLDPQQVDSLDKALTKAAVGRPWFAPATAVDLSLSIQRQSQDPQKVRSFNIRAVTAAWQSITPSLPSSEAWLSVMQERRLSAAILLNQSSADILGLDQPQAVSITAPTVGNASATVGPVTASGGAPDPSPTAVLSSSARPAGLVDNTPVFGFYRETVKALSSDGLTNQNVLGLLSMGAQPVQVFWLCEPARCTDVAGLVASAAAGVGTTTGMPQRVDTVDEVAPLLLQQSKDGQRIAWIVLALGALAVTVVATAFVEVRAPRYATLRTLGSSRGAIGMYALVENIVVALFVGAAAAGLGWVAVHIDPNRFNQIPQVSVSTLHIPLRVFTDTIAITLGIGLLTGLFPAAKAYRAVRAN